MTRAQTLQAIAPPYDPAYPPEGVRLRLGSLSARLRLTLAQLGDAAGISKTAMYDIVADNRWPVRKDPTEIRAAVEALLCKHGATPEQAATCWHARGRDAGHALGPCPKDPKVTTIKPQLEEDIEVLLPRQTLNMAARKAFGIFVNPFDSSVQSDEELFTNPEISFVREACYQAAAGGRFVALVAESGGGKTTIVQDMEARIARDRKQVIVVRPSVLGMEDSDTAGKTLKATDILAAIITTVSPLETVPQTIEARSRKAARMLGASIEAGFQHLLVIEEAHCLPVATLKHLKRLHELHAGRRPMLGILLVAQPELMLKLDPRRADLREVTQRCEVVQLMPLDGDLKAYLAHRAGFSGKPLSTFIDDSGVEAIRERLIKDDGGGRKKSLLYPLAVNNWMTAALNEAADLGVPVVSRDVVRSI